MDLLDVAIDTAVVLEKLNLKLHTVAGREVMSNVRMCFAMGQDVEFETLPSNAKAVKTKTKSLKLPVGPTGTKSMNVVIVQNEDAIETIHLFDSREFFSFKQKQDLKQESPKFHFFKVPREEVLVGFYGRIGKNCFKSIGLILYRPGPAAPLGDKEKLNLKSKLAKLKA